MTDLYTRKVVARLKQPDGHYGAATWVLVGAGPEDCDRIAKAPLTPLKTSVTAPRDGGRHRYVMKLFAIAHQALPEGWNMSFDTFRKALTVDAGYYEAYRTPDGDEQKVALSLSYGSMDDTAHRQFCDDLIKCLCSRWVPGLDHEAFTNEIYEAIA